MSLANRSLIARVFSRSFAVSCSREPRVALRLTMETSSSAVLALDSSSLGSIPNLLTNQLPLSFMIRTSRLKTQVKPS